MDNLKEIKDLLRDGITTAALIRLTGDKKAVLKAFELGAKINGWKTEDGIDRGFLKLETCVKCYEPFTDNNVRTAEGWSETKISKMCEDCFDDLFIERLYGPSDSDPRDNEDADDYLQPEIDEQDPF